MLQIHSCNIWHGGLLTYFRRRSPVKLSRVVISEHQHRGDQRDDAWQGETPGHDGAEGVRASPDGGR